MKDFCLKVGVCVRGALLVCFKAVDSNLSLTSTSGFGYISLALVYTKTGSTSMCKC